MTARDRALDVFTKWATRYTKTNALSLAEPTTPNELIKRILARRLTVRDRIFEQHLPFSWPRFLLGLVSLVLVSSDIFRSGLSVSNMQVFYPALQPDEVITFGTSWNNSVFSSTKAETTNCSTLARVWNYKFDTTSIGWRAFARYFAVSDFPDCIFYRERCPTESLCGEVVFKMIDSLVNALVLSYKRAQSKVSVQSGPITMALRSKNDYVDHLHQFLLPQWFYDVNWRTNQALYYSPALLENASAQTICYPARGERVRIPRFCQQLWINYRRSCAAKDAGGRAVGVIHVNIMERLRTVRELFPNLSVDLTLLESHGDLQVSKGGFSSLGFLWGDVSTIIRARNCTGDGANKVCETLYVDDYRYETGLLVSDIIQWYRVVAALRIIGQSYFFIRVIGLILSCYHAYSTPTSRPGLSRWSRLRKATSLFMKVPTQCVVYGSPFPVACYVLAHVLDAPFTYQILESRFFSAGGIFSFSFREFISYAVVQMRNVWLYTLGWHLVVSVSTSRWIVRNNRQNNGILGVPEFFLSAFSSLTLIAQYRSTSFRSTKILEVMALPDNVSSAWELVKYHYSFGYRGRGNTFLGGVIIDLKFLTCLVLAVAAVRVTRFIWLHYWPKKRGNGRHNDLQWYFIAPTPVPYSAGILWPSVSMCVHWTSDFFCIQETHRNLLSPQKLTVVNDLGRSKRQVLPLPSAFPVQVPAQQARNNSVSIVMSVGTFRYIQHQLNCLNGRSDVVEANVAFMNVVLMSDPLVYLRTVYGKDHRAKLAYYQSTLRPQQILLLPVEVVGTHNEYSLGLKLLRWVNPGDLSWAELVQCG